TFGGTIGITTRLAASGLAGGIAAASGHDLLSEVDATDLSTLVAALPARALQGGSGPAWYCSPKGAALVFDRLGAASGGLTFASGEWNYGRFPIRLTPSLPSVATTLQNQTMLCFGNLGKSTMFGTRQGLRVEGSSKGLSWESRTIQWMVSQRIAIQNHDL